MNSPQYKRDFEKSSLVFVQEQLTGEIYYQQQMLLQNEIKGLLSCSLHRFNGEEQLFYDISGKQNLSCIYEKRQMRVEDLCMIIQGIYESSCQLQEYLLSADLLLLSSDYIYIDQLNNEIALCFYPSDQESFENQLISFGEYLLEHTDHEDSSAVVVAYQFYRMVRQKGVALSQIVEDILQTPSEEKIEDVIMLEEKPRSFDGEEYYLDKEDLLNIEETETKKQPFALFAISMLAMIAGILYGGYCYIYQMEYIVAGGLFLAGLICFLVTIILYKKRTSPEKEKENAQYDEVEDVLEEPMEIAEQYDEKTILLAENRYEEKRQLVSQDRKHTVVSLGHFPFVVGTMKEKVDYAFTDKSVSHIHARFLYDEELDTVLIEDLNSTNGTFYNGVRLESKEQIPIYSGDEIRMGKRVFVYE